MPISRSKKKHKKTGFQQKVVRKKKKEAANCQETQQIIKPDSAMTQMLELNDKEFKITMVNMFRC